METPILDRPIPESSAPWPLSAPESYVLLHGPRAKSVEAFKRGLLELVARDVLTVETRERPRCFHLFTEQDQLSPHRPKHVAERAGRATSASHLGHLPEDLPLCLLG